MQESTPVETINDETEVKRIPSPENRDEEMEDVDEVISVVVEEVIAPDNPIEEVLKTNVEDFEMKQDANDTNNNGADVTLVETPAPEEVEGAVGGMVEQTETSQPSDTRPSSKLNVDLLAEQVTIVYPLGH